MSFFFCTQAGVEKQAPCRERVLSSAAFRAHPARACVAGAQGLLAAAAPHAGVLQVHGSGRETALILGYALDEKGESLTPEALARRWEREPAFQPDGYFAAAVLRADGSLTVAVDPLGLYPCFHTRLAEGGWVVASAAADLKCHPDFRVRPDLEGIAGQLLLNSPIEDRTVLEGVRMIPVRGVLHLRRGSAAEVRRAGLPAPPETRTVEEAREVFLAAWDTAFRRHAAVAGEGKADLLLSGGRDSRMVAASLAIVGRRVRALTFGLPGEYEAQAARAVARHLDCTRFRLLDDRKPCRMLDGWERRSYRAAGHGGGSFGGLLPHPAFSPWMFHGILLDDLLGGYAVRFARERAECAPDAKVFFERLNRWGIPADKLRGLFRDRDAGGMGEILRDRMLLDFEKRAGEKDIASFDWKFATRCRHHLGSTIWDLTKNTWPVMPACDQSLYALMRSVPLEWADERALQSAWMEHSAPHLRRIPFDNNTHAFLPEAGEAPRIPRWRRWRTPMQPLRYHRIFAKDSPGWLAVEKEANRCREALHPFFDPEVLLRFWPLNLNAQTHANPFAALAGARSLMVLAGFFAREGS